MGNEPSTPENENSEAASEVPAVDPRDLVYKGGYTKDPREIIENPAVTPEMPNEPGDLRGDLMDED